MKIFCLLLAAAVLSLSLARADVPDEIASCYHPIVANLISRLSQEGFDLEFLSDLFTDPRAELLPELMTISLGIRETPDLYARFLSRESFLLAQDFLRKNMRSLRQTEDRFQVDREIIVAILLVESRFGENTGRYRALSTLASMAVSDFPENLENHHQLYQGIDPELTYDLLEGLAKRRAEWAYKELKFFLQIVRKEKMDPLEVKSSYAGALGPAQFLPSSYLTFALNDKSFEEWLTSNECAFVSIANYLKTNGWKKNLPERKKRQVIWSYNHSEPYVNTILQVAAKLKTPPAPPKKKKKSQ